MGEAFQNCAGLKGEETQKHVVMWSAVKQKGTVTAYNVGTKQHDVAWCSNALPKQIFFQDLSESPSPLFPRARKLTRARASTVHSVKH